MKLSIIVAMDRNGVIGNEADLPWHISDDLKKFKQVTMGKPIVMGRKTHESIGRPLPGRENIILTRDINYKSEGCTVLNSVDAILAHCADVEEVMITGGAEIYRLFLDKTDRIYMTEVHAEVTGDTRFPDIDRSGWRDSAREDFKAGPGNDYDFSFVVMDRKASD